MKYRKKRTLISVAVFLSLCSLIIFIFYPRGRVEAIQYIESVGGEITYSESALNKYLP